MRDRGAISAGNVATAALAAPMDQLALVRQQSPLHALSLQGCQGPVRFLLNASRPRTRQ